MTISTEEIGRWISDDRKHSVNINSGVLSDMCCEIIRNRAKIEAAVGLAVQLENLLSVYGEPDQQLCCDGRMCGCQGATVHQEAEHYAKEALAAWEAAQ